MGRSAASLLGAHSPLYDVNLFVLLSCRVRRKCECIKCGSIYEKTLRTNAAVAWFATNEKSTRICYTPTSIMHTLGNTPDERDII